MLIYLITKGTLVINIQCSEVIIWSPHISPPFNVRGAIFQVLVQCCQITAKSALKRSRIWIYHYCSTICYL